MLCPPGENSGWGMDTVGFHFSVTYMYHGYFVQMF